MLIFCILFRKSCFWYCKIGGNIFPNHFHLRSNGSTWMSDNIDRWPDIELSNKPWQ